MKKAFIVTISATTRVVVDVPKDKEDNSPMRDDELFAIVTDAAIDKIVSNPRGYLVRENTEQIKEDRECPYGTFDKED